MRVLACLVAAAIGVAFAAFALVGVVTRVTEARSDQERAQRLADFGTLSYLVGRESRLVHVRRTDPATAGTIRDLLTRLERSSSSAAEMTRVVMPAVNAVALAEHGHETRAAAAYGRVRDAAQRAALQEAAAQRGEHVSLVTRLEDWSALAAAVLGSLLGLGLLAQRVRAPSRETDERVEQLSLQARTDSLTGLGNHRAFHETLSAAIADRAASNTPFVLLAIDLDGLKQINDTGGHLAGDTHIKKVADSLRAVVGDQGTVHRTGGDEFMVVLPGRRNWDGLAIARRIAGDTREGRPSRSLDRAHRVDRGGGPPSDRRPGRSCALRGEADAAQRRGVQRRAREAPRRRDEARPGRRRSSAPSPPRSRARSTRRTSAPRATERPSPSSVSRSASASECAGTDLERLRLAGLLHDVGKIGIADAILQKPRPLDQDERRR